jgi:hypothetical protein
MWTAPAIGMLRLASRRAHVYCRMHSTIIPTSAQDAARKLPQDGKTLGDFLGGGAATIPRYLKGVYM